MSRMCSVNPLKPVQYKESIESLSKQIAKGGIIAFVGNVIAKALKFGLHILLTRVLGASSYGLYSLGTSVVGVSQTFAFLGLQGGIVRFSSLYRGEEDNARVKGIIISALGISLVASILTGFILFRFSSIIAQNFFHKPELEWVCRVFAFTLPFLAIMEISSSFVQSFRRIEYQMGISIFRSLFHLFLVSLFFLLGFRLGGAVYGFLLASVSAAGLGSYLVWKILLGAYPAIHPIYEVKKLLKVSIPLLFVHISYFFALKTDSIMLGMFCTAKDVGIYSATSNVALQVYIFSGALIPIFMPIISDIHNKKRVDEVKKLYNLVTRWSSIMTIFVVLFIITYAQLIMSIFGTSFVEQGSAPLVILSVAQLGIIFGPLGPLLRMTGKQNMELFNGLLMIISNVILNFFLIPIWGLVGAAISTLVASCMFKITAQMCETYHFFRFHPFNIQHCKFIALAALCILASIAINVSTANILKLILFLLVFLLLTAYIYINKTSEDRIVFVALKRKLSDAWSHKR